MMKSKMMIFVFLLFAQNFFGQITITGGASIHVDGKNITSISKDSDHHLISEITIINDGEVLTEKQIHKKETVSKKKKATSIKEEFEKASPKKNKIAKTISKKKNKSPVFIPFSSKNSFSSSTADTVSSVLPSLQIQLKLLASFAEIKSHYVLIYDEKQNVFENISLVFYNHFHSSLSVRPPPSA